MNRTLTAASLFAAIAGMAMATATPSYAAPSCTQEMAQVAKDRDVPPVTGDMSLVDMHMQAAEKALQAGDEATCLEEAGLASMSILPDDHRDHQRS